MKFKIYSLCVSLLICFSTISCINLKNKSKNTVEYNQSNFGMNGMNSMGINGMGMNGMNQGSFSNQQFGSNSGMQQGSYNYQHSSSSGSSNSFNSSGFQQISSNQHSNSGNASNSINSNQLNQNQGSINSINGQNQNGNKYWQTLFGVSSERPKSICEVDITPKNKNNPNSNQNDPNGPGSNASVPFKKKNYRYNKPGFEDSAYLWDYMDGLMREKIVSAFKGIWEKSSKINSDPKVNNPYSLKNMLKYYAANGGGNDITFDVEKENDNNKIIEVLKKFNKGISAEETLYGIKLDQLNQILQSLSLPAPSKPDALKILIDRYDFNGDGVLNKEEFLYMVILEAKDKLNDKNLFFEVCSTILDPMFEFLDCNHDGFITAEGLWTGLKDLKRPNSNEYNMYTCLSKESKLPVRTTSVNDMVIKHHNIKTGALNLNEWRKAVLLGYWDRQVNGMKIFDGDENNKKETRWINKEKDKECDNL